MRTLHIIAPPARQPNRRHWRSVADGLEIETVLCARTLRATPQHDHTVITLGAGEADDSARQLGLRGARRAAMPAGVAEFSSRTITRLLANGPMPDAVQCWGAPAWRAVRSTWLADRAAVCAVDGSAVPSDIEISPETLLPLLDTGEHDPDERRRLRLAVGVPEDITLVALLGEPHERIDAWRFVFSMGLVEVCDLTVAGLLSTRNLGYRRGCAFHRESHRGWPLAIWEGPIAPLLPACDMAWLGGSVEPDGPERLAGRLWTALAHAAGVPVLAPVGRAHTDLYPVDLVDRLVAPIDTNPAITEHLIASVERDATAEIGRAVRAHMQAQPRDRAVEALQSRWQACRPAAAR